MTAPALDLDALEAVANKATPGPWDAGVNIAGVYRIMAAGSVDVCKGFEEDEDAEFIATFNPETALTLIAELREWRRLAKIITSGHVRPQRVEPKDWYAALDVMAEKVGEWICRECGEKHANDNLDHEIAPGCICYAATRAKGMP